MHRYISFEGVFLTEYFIQTSFSNILQKDVKLNQIWSKHASVSNNQDLHQKASQVSISRRIVVASPLLRDVTLLIPVYDIEMYHDTQNN